MEVCQFIKKPTNLFCPDIQKKAFDWQGSQSTHMSHGSIGAYTRLSMGPTVVNCKTVRMFSPHSSWGVRWFPRLHGGTISKILWNPGLMTIPKTCIGIRGGGVFGRCVCASQRHKTMIMAFGTPKRASTELHSAYPKSKSRIQNPLYNVIH